METPLIGGSVGRHVITNFKHSHPFVMAACTSVGVRFVPLVMCQSLQCCRRV